LIAIESMKHLITHEVILKTETNVKNYLSRSICFILVFKRFSFHFSFCMFV